MDLSVPLDSNSNINLTQHCNKYLPRSLTGGEGDRGDRGAGGGGTCGGWGGYLHGEGSKATQEFPF